MYYFGESVTMRSDARSAAPRFAGRPAHSKADRDTWVLQETELPQPAALSRVAGSLYWMSPLRCEAERCSRVLESQLHPPLESFQSIAREPMNRITGSPPVSNAGVIVR